MMYGFFYAQSEYSISDNIIHLDNLIEKMHEYNYSFLALADKRMHSFYKAIRMCENVGIKPIIGLDVDVENYNFLLYAKSNIGLKNLFKISSKIELDNSLTDEFLSKHNKDIFLVTKGSKSIIENSIINNDLDEAMYTYYKYKKLFKEIYIGLDRQHFPFDTFYDDIKEFVIKNNIKYLPIHQTSFLNKDDVNAYVTYKKIYKENVEYQDCLENYLKNIDELKEEFLYEDAFKYVNDVVNSIDIKIERITNPLIKYPNDKNLDSFNYLSELCYLGLKKRLDSNVNKNYIDRLKHELDMINKMGYADYFLIVFDFIRYAKKNDILVGPGRGSASGSLVSYCLGISEVDPIKYDLYFERFLNIERITMPDIDVDIPDNKRNDVINYIISKYGNNHVSFISTFDSFKGKSAINDISKAIGLEDYKIDEVTKKCLVFNSETSKYEITKASLLNAYKVEMDEVYKDVIKYSYMIYDLPKSISTHAAGIILSSDEVTDNYPIMKSNNGYQSQIEATDLEELGLLKMDLLSLKNLTSLHNILKLVNLKFKDISLDDKKTFDLLNSGDTKGIFQLEGRGITNVLKKYNLNSFMDLVNLLALYRPGPMDQIDEYIERKKGKAFSYPSKELEYILKPTYGIIVYQEQIMKIAHDYASYSLGEADVLRRAISKKKKEVLDMERTNFISRCKNKDEANIIYDYIVKFASYGFNKSHSVSYALVTYYLAYLKANYYKEFVLVFLNDSISDIKGSLAFFNDLKRKNINVLTPDINRSTNEYFISDNEIIMPLNIIKSITNDDANQIMEERKNGLFSSFTNFYDRVKLNNDKYLNLIYSSCFKGCKKDMVSKCLYPNVAGMETNIDYDYIDLVKHEYEALGFNYNYSILNAYKTNAKDAIMISNLDDNEANVLVHIKYINDIITKRQEQMAFVTINDGIDILEVTLFPSNYKEVMNEINRKAKVKYDSDVLLIRLKPFIRNGILSYEIIKAVKY